MLQNAGRDDCLVCHTNLECLLGQDSPLHKALFWVAVAVLQLDEVNLYSAGTALLEQNLHTLDSLRIFNDKVSRHSSEFCIAHSESSFPSLLEFFRN